MKKILLLAAAIIGTVSLAGAQEVFRKGDLVFNAGIGLNNSLYTGSGYKTTVPPLSISGEFGILEDLINDDNGSIGIGGYLGITGSKYEPIADYGYKYSSIIIGARGAFHYQFVPNLDTYAGAMLGYNVVSAKTFGSGTGLASASASGFTFSLFVGARYWFTPNVGAFTELGYGISNVNLGVAFRF